MLLRLCRQTHHRLREEIDVKDKSDGNTGFKIWCNLKLWSLVLSKTIFAILKWFMQTTENHII